MKAADRASRLTRQLLAFSRHQVLNPRLLSVNEIITGMEGMARRVVPENIDFVTELDQELSQVRADAGQMEQVFLNLVINGADAMPNGGQLAIRTANVEVDALFSASRLDLRPGTYVCITVSATGVGMDQETVSRIFEPFFTTKGVGKGTVLGLSTVLHVTQRRKSGLQSLPRTLFSFFPPRRSSFNADKTQLNRRLPAPGASCWSRTKSRRATGPFIESRARRLHDARTRTSLMRSRSRSHPRRDSLC